MDPEVTVGIGIESLTKGIIVRGKMHLFGERKNPVWTRLLEDATAGSNSLKVEFAGASSTWQSGDKLVIGSSSTD